MPNSANRAFWLTLIAGAFVLGFFFGGLTLSALDRSVRGSYTRVNQLMQVQQIVEEVALVELDPDQNNELLRSIFINDLKEYSHRSTSHPMSQRTDQIIAALYEAAPQWFEELNEQQREQIRITPFDIDSIDTYAPHVAELVELRRQERDGQ